jgi:hypothetical protein
MRLPELRSVSMNELLSIHTRTDARYAPEGAREVRLIAVAQMIRHGSCRQVEVLQHLAGNPKARVIQ